LSESSRPSAGINMARASFARIVAALLIEPAMIANGFRRVKRAVAPKSIDCPVAPLFGGSADWQLASWEEYSDKVRGGVSTGSLAIASDGLATISGVLDPSILNAGFGGVQLAIREVVPQFTDLSGIVLEIADGDAKNYTIGLEMEGLRPGDAHRITFRGEASVLRLPFEDFEDSCRGLPCEPPFGEPLPALDPQRVQRMTMATTSIFGENAGPFTLTLNSVGGLLGDC